MAARKHWSPNEDAYLRQHAGIKSFADIGAALNRSADSVHGRSRKLGLAAGWALAQITPDWLFDRLLGKRDCDE